jgi:hypothetical protein
MGAEEIDAAPVLTTGPIDAVEAPAAAEPAVPDDAAESPAEAQTSIDSGNPSDTGNDRAG